MSADAGWGETWYYLLVGLGAAVGTFRVLSHGAEQAARDAKIDQGVAARRTKRNAWYGVPEDSNGNMTGGRLDGPRVDALAQLALKASYRQRKAAWDVLLDQAMHPSVLALVIETAGDTSDPAQQLRVVMLLQALAQSTSRQPRLARAGALRVLVGCLWAPDKGLVLRAATTLVEFVGHPDLETAARYRRRAARCGLLAAVINILEAGGNDSSGPRSDAVMLTVCAGIAKVYSQRTSFHQEMVDRGYLMALLRVAQRATTDVELTRVVVEAIVRLCTYLSTQRPAEGEERCPQMVQLLDAGAVGVVAACVRQEDQSVSSWGIGLLHEFVSRGVGRQELGDSPGIVRWVCRKLSTAKYAYTNQLILRSLWSLCSSSTAALDDATRPACLRRILAIFSFDDDPEGHHWGIALVARLSACPATHRWILDSPLPHALDGIIARLPQNLRMSLLPEIAAIISRLCHSISLAPVLSAHPEIAGVCRQLMASGVEAAHLATIVAIINATATSRAFLRLVVDDGIRNQLLLMLADPARETAQIYAAKCLVALLPCGLAAPDNLVFQGLVPFLRRTTASFRSALTPHFMHSATHSPLSGAWAFEAIRHQVNTVDVLLTALRVFLATEERDSGHCLAAERSADVVAALFDYQEGLLAFLTLCLSHIVDTGPAVRDIAQVASSDDPAAPGRSTATLLARARSGTVPPGGGSCMCLAISAFVATYHWSAQDDPHFRDALNECQALLATDVCHTPHSPAATRLAHWPEAAPHRPHAPSRDPGNSDEDDDDSKAFEGSLRNVRLRCVLPAISSAVGALADSLEPGLMVQSPAVTRRAVWLARIVLRECPQVHRIMRMLSFIDTRTLSAADAAGLVRLCSAHLVDTALDARQGTTPSGVDTKYVRGGVRDVEVIVGRLVPPAAGPGRLSPDRSEPESMAQPTSAVAESEWLDALPVCIGPASMATLTPAEYRRRYFAFRPGRMTPASRFFAQFALDRYVAGWWTCRELFSCPEALGLAGSGADIWVIDRSGPRGAGRQSPPAVEHGAAVSPVSESGLGDGHGGADALPMLPPHPSVAFAPMPRAARASSSGSAGSAHHPRTRPPSPFPMHLDSDDGRRSPAVAGPPTSLGSAPGVLYRNHAPYYPAFTVLADGCTIRNASWRFESARMRTGVDGRLGGVHRFHVRLLTSGLLQIGWCSDRCGFYPESGEGVGDDYESVAYDGYRQRKWYGTAEDKPYGERWQAGDIITAELDLDNGRVVFYRNGCSLGLAFGLSERGVMEGSESGFQGLSRDRTWYPAFSFASDQGLVFLGSDDGDQPHHPSIALPTCDSDSDSSVEDMSVRILERQCERAAKADRTGPNNDTGLVRELAGRLRQLGVATALRIRFEFQDLDAFPCFALALPAGQGRITVGPVTDPANLSSYLQPRWWAVWTADGHSSAPDVRQAPAAELQQWFARCVATGATVRQRALMDTMTSSSWLYFIVLTDGRLCLAVVGDEPAASASLVVFDTEAAAVAGHVWLPTASPAVARIDTVPLEP